MWPCFPVFPRLDFDMWVHNEFHSSPLTRSSLSRHFLFEVWVYINLWFQYPYISRSRLYLNLYYSCIFIYTYIYMWVLCLYFSNECTQLMKKWNICKLWWQMILVYFLSVAWQPSTQESSINKMLSLRI